MKRLVAYSLILIVSLFLTLSLYSCGGGGGDTTSTSSTSSNLTPITQDNAKTLGATQNNATDSVSRSSTIASDALEPISNSLSGALLASSPSENTSKFKKLLDNVKNISGVFSNSSMLRKTLNSIESNYPTLSTTYSGQDNCSISGTYSYSGTCDNDNCDATYTFNSCNDGGATLEGNLIYKGVSTDTNADFTITTDNLTVIPNDNTTFPVKLNNVSFGFVGTQDNTTGKITLKVSMNGTFNIYYDDGTNNYLTESLILSSLTYDVDAVDDGSSATVTVNGKITDKSISDNESLETTFDDFVATSKTESDGSEDSTINGIITAQYSPDTLCPQGNGTFEFVTNTPMHYDPVTDTTTSGKVTINGNEVITYNSDGTITVTLDGAVIYSGSPDGFYNNQECEIEIGVGGIL